MDGGRKDIQQTEEKPGFQRRTFFKFAPPFNL
jgi:hypothetical protein